MEANLIQPVVAALISAIISARAYKKKSLNFSGAILGFTVMTIHIAVNYRFGAVLLVFFFTSSKFTKFGEDKKRKVDADFKEGGQRNWIQVLFNSGIATILVLIAWKLAGSKDNCLNSNESSLMTALMGGIIGHYCCCNGDTWSSELGILSDEQPRLITTFKPVQRGTNGGVTKAGLLAAAAGGSVIGLAFVLLGFLTTECTFDVALKQLLLIPLSAVAGLCGSVIDSLLGATLQFSGFCSVRKKVVGKPGPTVKKISGLSILDNNAVNLVSVFLTGTIPLRSEEMLGNCEKMMVMSSTTNERKKLMASTGTVLEKPNQDQQQQPIQLLQYPVRPLQNLVRPLQLLQEVPASQVRPVPALVSM